MTSHHQDNLQYFIKGKAPKILITSGMHGDEYETANLLLNYLKSNSQSLPDFVYIPYLSPSAVSQKTRKNSYGHDLNRSFTKPILDPEAQTITEFLNGHKFDLQMDFHEDLDRTQSFYFYDENVGLPSLDINSLSQDLNSIGIKMYNGIEDPNDPTLGYEFRNGYANLGPADFDLQEGFLSCWLMTNHIAKRVLILEVPMKASSEVKRGIIQKMLKFASNGV